MKLTWGRLINLILLTACVTTLLCVGCLFVINAYADYCGLWDGSAPPDYYVEREFKKSYDTRLSGTVQIGETSATIANAKVHLQIVQTDVYCSGNRTVSDYVLLTNAEGHFSLREPITIGLIYPKGMSVYIEFVSVEALNCEGELLYPSMYAAHDFDSPDAVFENMVVRVRCV